MHQSIWREGQSERPPSRFSNLGAHEVTAAPIGTDAEVCVRHNFTLDLLGPA